MTLMAMMFVFLLAVDATEMALFFMHAHDVFSSPSHYAYYRKKRFTNSQIAALNCLLFTFYFIFIKRKHLVLACRLVFLLAVDAL